MSTASQPTHLELVEALGAVAFEVMAALTKLAAEHDLSLTQLRMMGILRDRTLTISELARALGLDRSSVSGLVDRTEKRGLVQRQPNPDDARSVQVTASAHGAKALELGETAIGQALAPLTDGLNAAEARRLAFLLEQMLDHRGL